MPRGPRQRVISAVSTSSPCNAVKERASAHKTKAKVAKAPKAEVTPAEPSKAETKPAEVPEATPKPVTERGSSWVGCAFNLDKHPLSFGNRGQEYANHLAEHTKKVVEQVSENPSRYFVLVEAKINILGTLEERRVKPYRTTVYVIDRKANLLPRKYIDELETTLLNPLISGPEEEDDLDGTSDQELSKIRRFLHQLARQIYDISLARSPYHQAKHGIFVSTSGSVVAHFIQMAKDQPDCVHCVATVDADNVQREFWGLPLELNMFNGPRNFANLRMPIPFEHDAISKCAIATGVW